MKSTSRRTGIFLLIFGLLIEARLANTETSSFQETECKLVNITASLASTSMELKWESQGPCSIKKYKVVVSHLNYKACPDLKIKNTVTSKTQSTASTKTSFKNLEPYSRYRVSIEGRDDIGGQIIRGHLNVETLSDQPQLTPKKDVDPSPQTQAIHFSWGTQTLAALNETICYLQRGERGGFFIELYGLDEWSPKGLIYNKTTEFNGYYARGLKPYSHYSLMVYVRNKDGSVNFNRPLNMTTRTQPHTPESPDDTRATATSSEAIHLTWKPNYPPTGAIDKYKIRYGPKTEPMVWKKELEISNSTNPCAKKSQELKFVCTQVYELEANTTYAFQVKTFILGVSKDRAGSPWSQIFEATTDPVVQKITTTTEKPEFIMPSKSSDQDTTNPSNTSSTHLVIIIVSLVVIIVLVIVVAFLVYKIKMYKLKQKYESRRNGSIASNPGQFESLNVTALGSYYPGSLSTIAYNVPSVAYQVRDIQSRKLPDPPSPTLLNEVEQELYENSTLTYLTPTPNTSTISPDLIPRVDTPRQRSSTPKILISTSNGLMDQGGPQAEECTDIDGYLCPTFCEQPLNGLIPIKGQISNEEHATVIPTESYVSTVQLEAQNDQIGRGSPFMPATPIPFPRTKTLESQSRTTSPVTNESHPLISLTETTETF